MRRVHQCATIQLDFQLPIRFGLRYTSPEDVDRFERPVIIHQAILGSLERMIAILAENCNGKWPFWLSPRQACVVPVSAAQFDYAWQVRNALHAAGFHVDVDDSSKTLNKKVRQAQTQQYNYVLVVGASEEDAGTVNVRGRFNARHGEVALEDVTADFERLSVQESPQFLN